MYVSTGNRHEQFGEVMDRWLREYASDRLAYREMNKRPGKGIAVLSSAASVGGGAENHGKTSCYSTDSERPHRCCHLPNKVENFNSTLDIPYTCRSYT